MKTELGREKARAELMAALTSAIIAIAGLALAWVAVEIACKTCLEKGREAIDRALDPEYDPDLRSATQAPLLS